MIPKLLRRVLVASFCLTATLAQEIKVDFNANNRPVAEGWDTTYTSWNTNSIWFSGGDVISNTFSGITFTFRRVGPTGTGLRADRYAAGLTTAGWNAKLVSDGLQVEPPHITNLVGSGQSPARIELTISNLSAGPHTLLAWHNTWQNPSPFTFSPLNIYLNGTQIITNLPVSNRVTNNADAAYSYVSFVSDGINNTVIAYEASTDFNVTDANPCIDGFELDTPNFKFKANKPSPANGEEHFDADATKTVLLYWTKAALAVSNRIYFGTSSNAVYSATPASPEFKGNQISTNLLVTNLSSLLTYWWRVDQIDSTNGATKGDLWYFRTRHLAFPGAEGYGRFARGGRGGAVVKVTNLNDSGAGSFRDAIEGDYGPRTVIFDVSGLITLQSDITIGSTRPCLTIAGQTAPGKGICIRQQQLGLSGARDVIVRHLRLRVGKDSGETQNATGMSGVDHCIMDHCSISWGIDEELSTRTAKNLTFQRCFISEALNVAGHQNYPAGTAHGYAASIGGEIASFHHNLLAHNEGRNWSLAGGLDANGFYSGSLDIFNNVVYNWGGRTTDGGAHRVNFVNNYYKPGASSHIFTALNPQYGGFPGTQQYYMSGNVMPGHFTTANQLTGASVGTENGGTLPENSNPPYSAWTNAPFFPSYATIDEVTNAYKKVLSDVGCTQPLVDDHDVRVIRETIDGTYTYSGSVNSDTAHNKGLPDTTADVGGWEDYGNVVRPAGWDTDNDGMPDWWEQIKGSNPNVADQNGDPDGDEYTDLEEYLNWLASPHFDCTNGTPIDIDLQQFTRGFTNNSPVYFVSVPTNGTVTLVGNNRTARFTSTVSTNALGSFRFAVVDAQGYNMTNTINLRLTTAAAQPPVLGIRKQGGALQIELTGESGRSLTVQSKTNLNAAWLDWTNVTGNGTMQLLPLNDLTNQSPRYFRAFAQ